MEFPGKLDRVQDTASVKNLADKALEVLGFGEVEQDGVVDGGPTALKDADATVGVDDFCNIQCKKPGFRLAL